MNILNKICDKKKKEIEWAKTKYSIHSLKKLLQSSKNRKFKKLLINSKEQRRNNIIAEIKKCSPSAGEIIKDYFPDKIAIQYEKSGAGAISILTEKHYFKGDIDHLSLINRKTNIPILRKDFIIDSYQLYESKVFNADAVLLIATLLSDREILEFLEISKDIGLDCVIEVHNAEELIRAIKINHPIIGINNRNLDTLTVNTSNTIELIKDKSDDFTFIAESGIKNYSDIKKYNKSGIYNFLIGESILSSKNFDIKIKQLLNI